MLTKYGNKYLLKTMSENVSRGNSKLKIKSRVWEIKVGVFSPELIRQHRKNSDTKLWKIKVILN